MFPIAHGESQTKRHRGPRRETNCYFAIEVWACAWAIGNMHWASTELKLTFYLKKGCSVYPVEKLRIFVFLF